MTVGWQKYDWLSGELDQVRCESLEAQMQIWDEEVQAVVSEATSDGKELEEAECRAGIRTGSYGNVC